MGCSSTHVVKLVEQPQFTLTLVPDHLLIWQMPFLHLHAKVTKVVFSQPARPP